MTMATNREGELGARMEIIDWLDTKTQYIMRAIARKASSLPEQSSKLKEALDTLYAEIYSLPDRPLMDRDIIKYACRLTTELLATEPAVKCMLPRLLRSYHEALEALKLDFTKITDANPAGVYYPYLVSEVLKQSGLLLSLIDDKHKTESMCYEAMRNDPSAWIFVPDKHRTTLLAKMILSSIPCGIRQYPDVCEELVSCLHGTLPPREVPPTKEAPPASAGCGSSEEAPPRAGPAIHCPHCEHIKSLFPADPHKSPGCWHCESARRAAEKFERRKREQYQQGGGQAELVNSQQKLQDKPQFESTPKTRARLFEGLRMAALELNKHGGGYLPCGGYYGGTRKFNREIFIPAFVPGTKYTVRAGEASSEDTVPVTSQCPLCSAGDSDARKACDLITRVYGNF